MYQLCGTKRYVWIKLCAKVDGFSLIFSLMQKVNGGYWRLNCNEKVLLFYIEMWKCSIFYRKNDKTIEFKSLCPCHFSTRISLVRVGFLLHMHKFRALARVILSCVSLPFPISLSPFVIKIVIELFNACDAHRYCRILFLRKKIGLWHIARAHYFYPWTDYTR